MKIITKYQSTDGSEHRTQSDAEDRDKLCRVCANAMAPLGKIHKGVRDAKGWFQHDVLTVLSCKDSILEICREQGFDETWDCFRAKGRDCHPMSIIGRILGGIGGPLDESWRRFASIDEQGREHQQPYYAYTNGPLPEHTCLNP